MRRVIYSVAASLDGYIAGPDGEYDWIPDEPEIDWAAFMSRFDTVLMGRTTWELVAGQEDGPSAGLATYVFSDTLRSEDHPEVTVVRSDEARRVVAELRRGDGKDVWLMGGGVLFRSLLEADLVDVVEVGLVPVLLGRGLPLLPEAVTRRRLILSETKQYPTGILLLTYSVA
jgi:dihydrofolate reductase